MASRPVAIDFGDGKSRSLRYGSRVIRTIIEPRAGKDIYTLFEQEPHSHRAIALLLWAGLITEDPQLKLEDMDDLIDDFCQRGNHLLDLRKPIAEALLEAGVYRPAKRANGAAGPPVTAGAEEKTAPGAS